MPQSPIKISAEIGDYKYLYARSVEGIEQCERIPISPPGHPSEELSDWQQLPTEMKKLIHSAQNMAGSI